MGGWIYTLLAGWMDGCKRLNARVAERIRGGYLPRGWMDGCIDGSMDG